MRFEDRLIDRRTWSVAGQCSAGRTLDLLSTKTAFLILRECFYGTTRFEEFIERAEVSAPAASRALKQLESAGVLTRATYRDSGSRGRKEYLLTEAGEDLLPVFVALMQWGDIYLQDGHPPLHFVHTDTGQRVRACVTADNPTQAASDDIEIRLLPAQAPTDRHRRTQRPGDST